MYTLSVWNKNSHNYRTSSFHFHCGTNTHRIQSQQEALRLFNNLSRLQNINRIELDGPDGSLTWQRRSPCPCEECRGQNSNDDGEG